MDRHDRSHRPGRPRRLAPTVEGLEGRQLPSFFGAGSASSGQMAYRASIVRHDDDQYVGEMKRLELASKATPAEYLALRDDARSISATASGASLPAAAVQEKALVASLLIDRAPIDGWVGDAGWAEISSRLSTALDGLQVSPALIDQTVVDMRTLATSAGVGPGGFATFTRDFDTLRSGEQSLPANSGYHFEDPGLYYTQHLRGFFRGWGTEKVRARAALDRDLAAIRRQSQTDPAGTAVLQRDVRILEGLGAAQPSTTMDSFNATYVAAFADGTPTAVGLPSLRSNLVGILGPAGTSRRIASVDRLVGDAPAFYAATGDSESAVRTLVNDVGALVDAGGGESLNPFKVTIQPG